MRTKRELEADIKEIQKRMSMDINRCGDEPHEDERHLSRMLTELDEKNEQQALEEDAERRVDAIRERDGAA